VNGERLARFSTFYGRARPRAFRVLNSLNCYEHVIGGTEENDVWLPRQQPHQSSLIPEVAPIVDVPPLVFGKVAERSTLQVHGATQTADLVAIDGIHPTFEEVVSERTLARSGWTGDKNPSRDPTRFAPHVERTAPRVMNLPGRPRTERGARGLRPSLRRLDVGRARPMG
jgi:hypothetical protein